MKVNSYSRSGYAIGLVIYHPEATLLNRVDQMIQLGFQVYVFDNSPFCSQFSHIIQNKPNINYFTAGKNVGIGYSLSTLCATAYAQGYPRLLFLDQDTGISSKTLEFIYTFSQSLPLDIEQEFAALVFNNHFAIDDYIKEVRLAISSGSLFNLSALREIGWHSEKYFVDCVDYEFCVRARRCGFKIGLIRNTPDFDHVTEQPDQIFRLFGKQLLVRRYSPNRIKDALGSYLKLIIGGLFKNRLGDTYALTRSMLLYLFGQLISRLIQSK